MSKSKKTVVYMTQNSFRKFRALGKLAETRNAWQLELEMETLTPTPVTHKIINLARIVELYDNSIDRYVEKLVGVTIPSFPFSKGMLGVAA